MAAPSFSSFPSSFSSFPGLDSEKEGSSREARERVGSPKRRSDDNKRRKKDRHELHRSRVHFPLLDKEEEGGNQSRQPELNRLYYSDRRGDFLNIQFGGLHVGDIPRYHLVDNTRNVLGLPSVLVIHRRAGKGIEVGPSGIRKMSGISDPKTRALLKKAPERRLTSSLSNAKMGEEEDGIIRLPSKKAAKKPEDTYRSIIVERNSSDSYNSSSEDGSSTSSDEDNQPVLTAHQETLKNLEHDITANPADVDKWLALLHQTLSTIPITSKHATRARSEITISILSRALAADPSNAKIKILRILYLKAGEEVWHENKLKAEWEEALKDGDIEIIMEWLEWRSRKGNGGFDIFQDSVAAALSRLGRSDADEIAKLRLFWRLSFAIRSAGYSERAMAMFQAQAELMFYHPVEVSRTPFHSQLDELEEFWESEVPRIGEDDAKGWNSWYPSKSDQRPSKRPPLPSAPPDLDPYREWAREESLLDSKVILAARSGDTSDPYSTVLFSDIRSLLLDLRSRHAKECFRLAWLSFLGLHVPGFNLSTSPNLDWDDRWNLEFLTKPPYLNAIFPSNPSQKPLLTHAVAGVVVGREKEYGSPFGPVRCWGYGVSDPLDLSSAEPGKFHRRGMWSQNDIAVDGNVIRRIFALLRMEQDDAEWDSLALAFESVGDPKIAVKKSKEYLSGNSNSLGLWGAHAQLEKLRGRLDDARKVYQTILVASRPKNTLHTIARMWWNWAEMEWLAGDEKQTLNIILRSVNLEGASSGVTLLRAKRLLEDLVESTDLTNWKDRVAWIRMRALLELLTGHQPCSAMAFIDKYLSGEKPGSFNESLTTSALLMLYLHGVILRNPMPPSVLRERAYAAFEKYPSNSIVLGLLLEAEKGQGIWGRLRAVLGDCGGKTKDVARRIEEVWIAGWEKSRWFAELERTRNGLAAAIEHERTRSSSVIWRIYIEFEIRVGELQRAKKLLFRAIGECPMVKGLYLLAFEALRSVFSKHELNALADTMVERGLRLHRGLDEVLGEVDVTTDNKQKDEDEMDEIEYDARELKRLKPY